jgi:molybdopterin-guanine dinucleotide biosynthesis protein A
MGRTKALIEIDGVPMAARVAAALRDAGCTRVLASGGDPGELLTLGLPFVADRYPGSGPLGGVLGLLELFASEAAEVEVFVAACDMPLLSGAVLAPMVDAAKTRPDADVVVAHTTRVEPACAIWRVSSVGVLREMYDLGERALHVAIERLDRVLVDVDSDALLNINTPDELGGYS